LINIRHLQEHIRYLCYDSVSFKAHAANNIHLYSPYMEDKRIKTSKTMCTTEKNLTMT